MRRPLFRTVGGGTLLWSLAVPLAGLVGAIDYLTGPRVSFGLFYLLPVGLLGWRAGRRSAAAMAVLCAAIWLAAEWLTSPMPMSPALFLWNAFVRLGFFLTTGLLVADLAKSTGRLKRTVEARNAALMAEIARRDLAGQVLDRLNRPGQASDLIGQILRLIRQCIGVEAVGIRLQDGPDYPYAASIGFPDDFVAAERSLCVRDETGRPICDEDGRVRLECMCGRILNGQADPSRSFFSLGGSFWTNSSSDLLAQTTEQDRGRTRNRCAKAGYESVALIPLRSAERVIGLLQLNDPRRDCFDPQTIMFLEELAASIGIALARKKTEDRLRQHENELAEAQRIAHVGNWVWSIPDNALSGSQEVYRILGLGPTDFAGTYDAFLDRVRPADRERVRGCVDAALKNDEPYSVSHGIVRPDGTARVVHGRGEVVRDQAGQPVRMIGTLQDITDQSRVEGALRDSEERYRRLTGAVTDYMYTVAVEHGRAAQTTHGPGCVGVTGYTPEEFAADPYLWLTMVHADDRPVVIEQASRILAEPDVPPLEHRIVRKDGSTRWVASTIVCHRDGQGRLLFYDGLVKDITERKRAELRLEEMLRGQAALNDLLRLALEDLPLEKVLDQSLDRLMAIPWLSLEGKGAIFLADGDSAVLVPKAHRDLARSVLTSCARVPFGRCLCGRAAATGEVVFADCVGSDHETRYDEMAPHGHYCVPLTSPGGKVLGVLNLYVKAGQRRDSRKEEFLQAVAKVLAGIIQRNRLAEALSQSQKMEAIGLLAGGVAHDFNNILTGITGYAQLALEQTPQDHPMAQPLTEVCGLADRAAELTGQLLAFSRKQPLTPVITDLGPLVGKTARLLRRLIGKNIELNLVTPDRPALVRADPGRIEQVMLNLAVNARDAMPAGGRLTIEMGCLTLGRERVEKHGTIPPGRYVTLTVRDTGCGMDEHTLARIFEPFFTTKPPGKGTGLGLATVYGIVTQHGGHLAVASQPGQGAAFTVYLPQVDQPAESGGPLQPGQEDGHADEGEPAKKPERDDRDNGECRPQTILLVEDEPAIRLLVEQVLSREGYKVLSAACPDDAEDLFAAAGRQVDLLLTNVVMPGRNGRQLFDRLALEQPDLLVVYMSGYVDDAINGHGLLAPGEPFVAKPFTADAILGKVRSVLGRPTVPSVQEATG